MPPKKIIIYTDGGARGNPGPAALGVVIGASFMHGEYIGETTNNVAEYSALIYALKHVKKATGIEDLKTTSLEVRMDSELIVKQMKGEYKVKNAGLRELFSEVQKLIPHYHSVSFQHIRREKNKEADAMVNKALDSR